MNVESRQGVTQHRTSNVDVASLRFFNKIETPKAYHNSTLEVRCSMFVFCSGFGHAQRRRLRRVLKFRIWNLSFDFAQDGEPVEPFVIWILYIGVLKVGTWNI